MGEIFVLFGCYPKEMDGNQEEIHNILVALLSGDEKEIYKVLYKKKEIDDKTPKLRTEDEKKKLKSLSYQMSKFPKNLIDGIKKKFPFLERTRKTAEQRKEQKKECKRQKRAAETEIEQEMRVKKQKEFELERYTQSPQFRAKKVQEVREKRCEESEIEKERRLTQDKEYHRQKRSEESEIEKERRLNNQKKYEHKRFSESTEFRAKKVQEVRERRRQPSKDWKQELIDKASLTHICTSECRYRPKASMVLVKENMFSSKQMELLKINNETLS